MIYRLITAIIGIPLTAYLIIVPVYNDIFFALYMLLVTIIISEEILVPIERTLKKGFFLTRMSRLSPITLFVTWAMITKVLPHDVYIILFSAVIAVFFYICGGYFLFSRNYPKNMELFGAMCFHFVTVTVFMNSTFILKFYQPYGAALVILMTFAWVSDAAGMFSGMLFGKHRLEFLPSGKKTLEGYIGSVVVCLLLGLLFSFFLQGLFRLPFQWPLWRWMLFGLCISITANFGDLVESYFKRWAGLKDSGSLLPGMGGLFDAIDSVIYSSPIGLLFFIFP